MEVGEKGQELGRCQKKAGVREKKKKKNRLRGGEQTQHCCHDKTETRGRTPCEVPTGCCVPGLVWFKGTLRASPWGYIWRQ